ncbi:hypothetical protein Y1Q_0021927 [Alligator mississippiensis]|uniref:VWFD domain-containing protein n=2 Tax=Alligator mississippiensis TaxID=8496 RepID=A0A151MJK7_ALLMI|nr:hypothetical protein Y1Q_0021927 [Alligator mississippiensis]
MGGLVGLLVVRVPPGNAKPVTSPVKGVLGCLNPYPPEFGGYEGQSHSSERTQVSGPAPTPGGQKHPGEAKEGSSHASLEAPSPALQAAMTRMMGKMLVLLSTILVLLEGGTEGRHVGRDFITAFMQNSATSREPSFQLFITGFSAVTKVSVSAPNGTFHSTVMVEHGKTATVQLPNFVEMWGTGRFNKTILVQADQDVAVLAVNYKLYTVDTTVVQPVGSLGTEYYLVTPSGKVEDSYKEFAIIAGQVPATVTISLTAPVTFEEQVYKAGKKLTLQLQPFQAVQLQSRNDLSGSHVVSSQPVAILSGHSCASQNSPCDHVVEQLLPVPSWGSSFVVPPLSFQRRYDVVYVVAAQKTRMSYRSGRSWRWRDMGAGQVQKLEITRSKALYITSTTGIQVLFFCTGGTSRGMKFDPFLITIPPISDYCLSYHLDGLQGFENYALVVTKSMASKEIALDGHPLADIKWNVVSDTEYSWAEYGLGDRGGSHTLTHPNEPFMALSVGISSQYSGYGAAGLCGCSNPISCSNTTCRKMETCQAVDCRPVCMPTSEASCQAWGASQYHTFDGQDFKFGGTCTYTITKTCGPDKTLPAFTVEAKSKQWGNTQSTYVSNVTIQVYGITLSVVQAEDGFVRVNNESFPLPVTLHGGKVWAYENGASVVIVTDFSLRVYYDWDGILVVNISSSFAESLCGLCGNYNGNPKDDFTTLAGTLVVSPSEFGKSWKVPDGDLFCWDECQGDCQLCPPDLASKYRAESFCGWLTKGIDSPFSQCQPVIDPQPYVDACVISMCQQNGHQEALCQALKNYTDACRRQGIPAADWRTPTACPLACPEDRQYKFCSSACPATCDNLLAPKNCSLPCMETCECREGFVLDAGKCVPRGPCGCEFEGRIYAPGEKFWGDRNCSRWCLCNPQTGQADCQEVSCKTGEECRVEKGIQGCYPANYTTCTSIGDPHYITFDGQRFDFQGSCLYQLAGLCKNPRDLVDFQVLVQNDNRGLKTVSFTRVVEVRVHGVNITISREHPGRVLVNGLLTHLPYSTAGSQVAAFRRGQEAAVHTDFGLTVAFDWQSRVVVTLPSTYAGTVCGLCGNFNGDGSDDLLMKDGRAAPSPTAFGRSWRAEATPGCAEPDAPRCSHFLAIERKQRRSVTECGMIRNPAGPFRACHGTVDPQGYFQDCVYDYCFYRGHQGIVCQLVAAYATACQAAGVAVETWRSKTFCNLPCPRDTHYELCGPGCPATCHKPSSPATCDAPCAEGCFCDAGYVLSGDRCVPAGECGCVHQDHYYNQGEIFYTDASCHERCQCQANRTVMCQPATCGASEECRVERGMLGCHPTHQGSCVVTGSSHYISFDGRAYDLQGSCTYILAQDCGGDQGPGNFSVVVETSRPREGSAALAKAVVVSACGHTVALERGMPWNVTVDRELYTLPLSLDDGKLWANQEGNNIIIQAASGLQVLYDTSSYVLVTVPSTYQGRLCGLCGNYNGDESDDFLLPTGKGTQNVDEFGASWKVPTDGVTCSDSCGDQCPICDETKMAPYLAETSCGLIPATSGPFASCHSLVNPNHYFNHCVHDMCVASGTQETLCQNLQAYAAACQVVGAQIRAWRSSTFCPLLCPEWSHYEPCTHSCAFTCASLAHPVQCTQRCYEGCQCDDGFLFDGDKCVFPETCGCFHDRRYIRSQAAVMTPNCTQRCTCHLRSVLLCESSACNARQSCTLSARTWGCASQDGLLQTSSLDRKPLPHQTPDPLIRLQVPHVRFQTPSLVSKPPH